MIKGLGREAHGTPSPGWEGHVGLAPSALTGWMVDLNLGLPRTFGPGSPQAI